VARGGNRGEEEEERKVASVIAFWNLTFSPHFVEHEIYAEKSTEALARIEQTRIQYAKQKGRIIQFRVGSFNEGVAMPSDTEMAAYAKNLPPIYHDIMAAFLEIEPGRKAGYGLAFQTIAMHFANTKRGHGLEEVREACKQLAGSGFVEIKNDIFVHPTDLGEQLIAVVTGKPRASKFTVPQLPPRTW
jgi:hypothetical protein